MERLLCPSMMCADFSNLKKDTLALDQAGADIFHMDVMDGAFVPNFGIGLQDFEFIRSITDKLVDVHLMIQNPGNYVEKFADLGADILYIHPEADQQVTRTLEIIRSKGKQAGIALNPGTSIASIKELLPIVDYVMVMTVNPGFSGQRYLKYTDAKTKKLVKLASEYGFKVMVDGAISPDKVKELSQVGVTGFILGTSSVFGKSGSYKEIFDHLRTI